MENKNIIKIMQNYISGNNSESQNERPLINQQQIADYAFSKAQEELYSKLRIYDPVSKTFSNYIKQTFQSKDAPVITPKLKNVRVQKSEEEIKQINDDKCKRKNNQIQLEQLKQSLPKEEFEKQKQNFKVQRHPKKDVQLLCENFIKEKLQSVEKILKIQGEDRNQDRKEIQPKPEDKSMKKNDKSTLNIIFDKSVVQFNSEEFFVKQQYVQILDKLTNRLVQVVEKSPEMIQFVKYFKQGEEQIQYINLQDLGYFNQRIMNEIVQEIQRLLKIDDAFINQYKVQENKESKKIYKGLVLGLRKGKFDQLNELYSKIVSNKFVQQESISIPLYKYMQFIELQNSEQGTQYDIESSKVHTLKQYLPSILKQLFQILHNTITQPSFEELLKQKQDWNLFKLEYLQQVWYTKVEKKEETTTVPKVTKRQTKKTDIPPIQGPIAGMIIPNAGPL